MNDQQGGGRELLRKVTKVRPGITQAELLKLRTRVADLEAEVQENRRLTMRVAELLDLVEELLVPLAQRDEEKVQRFLDRHSGSL
ncbi:MAG: DUF6752 domain-containing protein [Nocardioidaceae bacterium]